MATTYGHEDCYRPRHLNRSIGSKKKSSCSSASSAGCAASRRASWKKTRDCSARSRRLKTRVSEAEGAVGELTELRDERDQIRTRVTEMLQQLDALNL